MAYTVESKYVDSSFSVKFMLRRLLRLTPPYYFAIIFAIAFLLLKKFATHEAVDLPSRYDFFMHLVYLQELFRVHEINTIFWTLCVEVQFYFIFILLVLLCDYFSKKFRLSNGRTLIFTVIGLFSLPWAFNPELPIFWIGGFIKYWYSFMAGALVCWSIKDCSKVRGCFVVIYILLIVIAGLITQQKFVFTAGVTASLLLFAGVNNHMNSWLNWKWLQKVGLISYSLYLLHNPVTGATANILHKILHQGIITDILVTFSTIAASLVSAWVMYKFIEMPSIRFSHKVTN